MILLSIIIYSTILNDKNYMQMRRRLIILCFLLFTFRGAVSAADDDPNHISINCGGGAAPATALSGRKWGGDAAALKGSSTASTVKGGELITAVDPVPYKTARISRSQFSYSFHFTPGQKFIRLHFNPVSYYGFQSSHDFFTVEAGPFTLLANFSPSITARALSLNLLAKEFCIIVQENQPLHLVFSPETSQCKYNYAFVNGIEIISVPSTISYCHGGDTGVDVLGQKSVIYVDSSSALERVYQQNIKWGSVSFGNDIGGMFGIWASILQGDANKASNLIWEVCVDVGFRYLVRVHLCEIGLKMDFTLMINDIVALTSADMLQQSENQSVLWYNYMVMVQGKKREGNKHRISISLHSQHELVDRQGPLEGFEVFKLSNHDLSLATPNPPLPPPPHSILTLLKSLLGHGNAIATVVFTMICLVNIILHLLHNMWETASSEEENDPCVRPKQTCCRFSLAEIQSATDNFHSGFIIGKGGFGNVYKGFIDNGREIVAIKRLKPDSNQGKQQFQTEVELLSELRHVNLVSLLGFCVEQQEMILVYEYMPCGTLADHLFKLAQKSHDYNPLSWKQRLKICIGAGRALDYLHTGHGIIHRDVKSSNILLDEKFVAKVSDFGLAKTGFGSESQSQNSTLVKGTRGYLDPYYCETNKPTKKSDTYSFGVVLLEVLCGRRALERHSEEDKCRLTTWAIDNISKGQVDHIVFPSLIGEISPESLKTFVKVAKRCLHDEPKKRPAIARVVMKLELALQHQEKANSLDPNERSSVEDLFSSTDENQRENMNFMAPNEKINIVDTLPQMQDAKSVGQNEIRNITDAMPCTHNDRTTILSVDPIPMASSSNAQTVTSLPIEQINGTVINSGRKGGRKSMVLRISQKLWPWDAFWKTRKPSNKTDLVGTLISAPISRRTRNITMDDNSIKNNRSDGMVLTSAAESSNEKEEHSRTMHNISKGQVDHIVAPTLRGEISPDSLRTFVNTAERWLHDEPKNRPKTLHIVTKIELALEQQEKAEPLPPKDRTSVEGVSSSAVTAGTSQKKNMNFMAPDEKINVADDASPSSAGQMLPYPNLRDFSFAELKAATRNFKSDSVLGEGGFGKVYKGWLDERFSGKTTLVAVKKLNCESMQGFREWNSEVNFLGRISHPNLVKLLGYCWEEKELLLVYEFMPKGSVEKHLFGRGSCVQPLPWDIRLKILNGAARGLAFLHTTDIEVIYRDFKPSNILLDGSYQAKLSDFGLAKLGPTAGHSHVTTQVIGTFGYAAPEYIATGHLYVKSDVYGFGVVLVEMLTGLRALDTNRPCGQQNLVDWIKPHLLDRRKLKRIIDVRLEGRYPSKSALQLARLALTCLESEPKNRPSMKEIVETLERLIATQRRVHFSQ